MADENKKERSAPGAAAAAAGAASTSASTSATTAKDEFQRVVSQHDKHAGRLARDLGENRKEAAEKVAKLTSTLVSGINRGVLEVFENQKQVEKEAKILQKKVEEFKEESGKWVKSLEDFDESLKAIGDFENYVMTLEKELVGISEELKKRRGG